MFGLSLKEKTESVIENEFHYVVSDMQRQNFRMLVSEGKSLGQNEYSIAIMYMLGMMNMLAAPFEVEGEIIDPKDGRNEDEKEQFENFITLHVKTISEIKHLANSPESDIQEMVDQVLINSNLLEISEEQTPSVEQDPEEEINLDLENHEEATSSSDDETSSIKVEDIESSDKNIEDESEVEPLMIGTDAFLASMQVANALIQSSPGAKYLSPYQLKIVYGLQLLGGID